MANQVMRGATTARKIIEDRLRAEVPNMIDIARVQWALQDYQLPYPLKYDAYDPQVASVYPTIGSLATRTSDWVRTGINAYGEETYDAVYAMRVFVWTRTPGLPDGTWETPTYETAMRVRDDLLSIIRTIILTTPSLGRPGVCRVNERTLTEDYLDAIKSGDENPRWMAGGLISFDMQLSEANYLAAIGEADSVTVESGRLTP